MKNFLPLTAVSCAALFAGSAAAVVDSTANPLNVQTCFYEQPQFAGAALCVDPSEARSMPRGWNDRARSVRVAPGYALQGFVHNNFGGNRAVFQGEIADLAVVRLNRNLSSFRHVAADSANARDANTEALLAAEAARSKVMPAEQAGVCFFDQEALAGQSICFGPGEARSMPAGWNDRARSAQVAPGFQLTGYVHNNFSGREVQLSGSTERLAAVGLNRNLSSFKLTVVPQTGNGLTGGLELPEGDPSLAVDAGAGGSSAGGGAGGSSAGGGASGTSPAQTAAQRAATHEAAMRLWHNDDLHKHAKGSCASCHGADFFDLAAIGSSEADIVRRAVIDGATPEEAEVLRQAILNMREQFRMEARNARTFRPFQPGGQILLPELDQSSAAANEVQVRRDIAFAEQVQRLAPTLISEQRISTLADARRAREEMLDIARGTNLAGANTQGVQLRQLPVGLHYPLWSADKAHGEHEATFNDWLADVGLIAKPEHRHAWMALQTAYLQNPSNSTFWAMYAAVSTMLQPATPLGACGTTLNNDHLACGAARRSLSHKFRAALIGQHMLRLQQMGRLDEFMQGPIAFAYTDQSRSFADVRHGAWGNRAMLPADLWEIGDVLGRVAIQGPGNLPMSARARELGFPEFVAQSVSDRRTARTEGNDLRLPWFWIGFTFDPSFARISAGNASRVAEYMVATLNDRQLFNHNAFMTHMRLLAATYLPEAAVTADRNSPTGVRSLAVNDRLHELLFYSYFVAYGRNTLSQWNQWNESRAHGGTPLPTELKDRSLQLWSQQVSNGMRMTLLLMIDELQTRPQAINRSWVQERAAAYRAGFESGDFMKAFREHWAKFQPQHRAADEALLRAFGEALVRAAGV